MPPTDPTLDAFTKDFFRLQRQKHHQRGGVESRVLTNLAFYYGEHYIRQTSAMLVAPPLDQNKLHLVFNLVRKTTRRKMGRLWAMDPPFKAAPDRHDPRSFANAEVIDKLIVALDGKVSQPSRLWEILYWLALGGVAVEYCPWAPDIGQEPVPQFDPATGELLYKDSQGGQVIPAPMVDQLVAQGRPPEHFTVVEELQSVGDVDSRVYGPLNLFVDSSVKSLRDLSSDQAVYLAEIKTLGWIRSNFGAEAAAAAKGSPLDVVKTQLRQIGPTLSGMNLSDLIPTVQGGKGNDDPDMAMVIVRYQPPHDEFPQGRETFFVPGKITLQDGENPYEAVPMVDFHYEPAGTSFWTGDPVTDLIPAQKFLNKRLSQLGEQANASIYDLVLLGPNLTREDVPADFPGFVEDGLNERGEPQVARLPGPSLPGWFLESIKIVIQLFQEIGGADLFQRQQVPGQMRGPLAIPMYQEIMDSEDGPLYSHLGERMAWVKEMRMNRVKQFYPPLRTLNYAGRNLRDEVLVFHTEQILRAGTNYTIRVDRAALVPELFALRESRIRERLTSPLALLYMDPRTGALDPSKIAADLKYGDLSRVDRESQGRKLAQELIGKLWAGEPIPQPMPFWPHHAMMDELEAAMLTTEWFSSSPAVQNGFIQQWNLHREHLAQAAAQQQQGMQAQQMQSAVAQATQMAAAKAAAMATEEALGVVSEQQRLEQQGPSMEDRVAAELQAARQQSNQQPGGPTP